MAESLDATQAFDVEQSQAPEDQTQAFEAGEAGEGVAETQPFPVDNTLAPDDTLGPTQAFDVLHSQAPLDSDSEPLEEEPNLTQPFDVNDAAEEGDEDGEDRPVSPFERPLSPEPPVDEEDEDDEKEGLGAAEQEDEVPKSPDAEDAAGSPAADAPGSPERDEAGPASPQAPVPAPLSDDEDDDDGPADPKSPAAEKEAPGSPAAAAGEDEAAKSPKADSEGPKSPPPSPKEEAPRSPASSAGPASPQAPIPAPLSDSEDSDAEGGAPRRPAPAINSDDDSGNEMPSQPSARPALQSDGEDSDGPGASKAAAPPRPASSSGSEAGGSPKPPAEKDETEQTIADIFGDEGEKEAGAGGDGDTSDEDADAVAKVKAALAAADGEEEGVEDGGSAGDALGRPDFEWDFDKMLKQKKAERGGKKKRRRKDGGIDLQGDADETIREVVTAMKDAADDDRRSNKVGQPAVRKRKMLQDVVALLRKADYREALVEDFGIVPAIAEWLAPLPDKSLPALEIRSQLLASLQQMGKLDGSILRRSGIGKSVMILYKHPKETKENRSVAGRLISEWSRPIFELDTDYRNLSKEERQERDLQMMPTAKKARLSREDSATGEDGGLNRRQSTEGQGNDAKGASRPGEKGWVGRARVPKPSTKDYVVRPRPIVEKEFKKESKIKSGLSKKLLEYKNKQKAQGGGKTHAVEVSIEGRKMQL